MKRIIFFVTVLMMFSFRGQAQVQTKKDAIKLMFNLMHQDTLISKTFEAMTTSLSAQMSAQFKDTSYSYKMAGIMERNMEKSKEIARRLINEDMVDIYDKYFTQQEIEDFVRFYKSKSGQQMINKLPEITKDIMKASQKYVPELQQSMVKELQEITNKTSATQ